LVVSDGAASTRQDFAITITNVNRSPVWNDVPQGVNGRENDQIQFTVRGSDPDNDRVTISFQRNNLPNAASVQDNGDGTATFSWQPNYENAGDYSAGFRISDGQLSTDISVPHLYSRCEPSATGD